MPKTISGHGRQTPTQTNTNANINRMHALRIFYRHYLQALVGTQALRHSGRIRRTRNGDRQNSWSHKRHKGLKSKKAKALQST